jgi:hypothetical protein
VERRFRQAEDIITGPADARVVLDEMASALGPHYCHLDAGHVRLVPVGATAGLLVSAVIERETGSPVSVAGPKALHAQAPRSAALLAPPTRNRAVLIA